jgi:hypothetical protein
MLTNIPEILKSKDILFHYTKMNTAIEKILFEQRLKLFPRAKSIDPLENCSTIYSVSQFNSIAPENKSKKIIDYLKKYESKIKQLSFCMNNQVFDLNSTFYPPLEYYGFIKPRMWDQYADKYQGVCLAFDKTKINLTTKIPNIVKYEDYEYINEIKSISIDKNRIDKIGIKKYKKEYFDFFNESLFLKHKDYKDENEFRIISFKNQNIDYISIKKSLIAIIISNDYISDYHKKYLINYSKKKNIELIYINWSFDGIFIETQKDFDYFTNLLK